MSTGILTSFFYFQRFDFTRIPTRVPMVADSGAFSAYTSGTSVDVDEYGEWLTALPGRFRFAFNLDVIGDDAGSFTNWVHLAEHHGQLTVPVLHYGDRPEKVIPEYLAAGATRLACGGVAVPGQSAQQVMAWCAHVLRWVRAQDTPVPVHGLGIHMSSPLARLPWASTDSSTFGMAWRFGRLRMWYRRRWSTILLDGREPYRQGAKIRAYGVEPGTVAVSTPETREAVVRLATRIECQAAVDHQPGVRYLADTALVEKGRGGIADAADEVDRYLVEGVAERLEWSGDVCDRYVADAYGRAGKDAELIGETLEGEQ